MNAESHSVPDGRERDDDSRAAQGEQRWLGTQRIGRYEVVRRLALGGMAELFLGRVTGMSGFEKLVAVKRILPHLAGDSDFVAMFGREARIAASLEHPNIVHVSDLGHDGRGDYYIVMPFLVGKDLLAITRDLDRRGETMPLNHAITIVSAIAAGLDYAHHKTDARGTPLGIVHRDVSPSNIFVTYGGEIKLLDFGIARASSEVRITRPGIRKGKTRYMSPEQCQDLPLDGRSDVFSLGVILYELTTGRRLFDADNDAAAIDQIVRNPISPPSKWMPNYPPELERIVMASLAQDRGRRYATARQLRDDLEHFAHEHRLRGNPLAVGEFVAQLFGAVVETAVDHGSIPPPPHLIFEPLVPAPFVLGSPAPIARGVVARAALVAPAAQRAEQQRRWGERAAIGIIVVASLTAVITAGSWWWRRSGDPSPAVASTTERVNGPAPGVKISSASVVDADDGSGPTPQQLLAAVNHPDRTRALDFGERHSVLAELRKHPEVWSRVDTRLQLVLDLMQAGDSADPCSTMDHALLEIAKLGDPYFLDALNEATIPAHHPACDGLRERLIAVRAQVSAREALSKR
ncbi:MAG TPA: serine/threonine-protein kinase [Nannocystaceae bacterium]|nr:serine/threonine-protein kinase [Nannocystaceae bacterium]